MSECFLNFSSHFRWIHSWIFEKIVVEMKKKHLFVDEVASHEVSVSTILSIERTNNNRGKCVENSELIWNLFEIEPKEQI